MKNVLLLGGSGLVGTRIQGLLSTTFHIVSPSHNDLDVTKQVAIRTSIADHKPDVIIYAAGITNPDKAEEQKKEALAINAGAPSMVAAIARETDVKMLYLSTDAVFNGNGPDPYKEDERTNPVNYYGYTKQKGEEHILSASDKNTVLRLITVYSDFFPGKRDIARLALDAFAHDERFTGIIDQYLSPTYVDHAVYAIAQIIKKNIAGILHVGASDCISNYSFVSLLAKLGGFDHAQIDPLTFAEFYKDSRAKRSKYACLDTGKSLGLLGNECIVPVGDALKLFWMNYRSRFSSS